MHVLWLQQNINVFSVLSVCFGITFISLDSRVISAKFNLVEIGPLTFEMKNFPRKRMWSFLWTNLNSFTQKCFVWLRFVEINSLVFLYKSYYYFFSKNADSLVIHILIFKSWYFLLLQCNSINIARPINERLHCFSHIENQASRDINNSSFWLGQYVKDFLE